MNISSLPLLIVCVLILGSLSSSAAQERIFENKIPAHIPIKIKIKKEKEESFKDLKNEKWLREFELEVTNTVDKPIYFLLIHMGTNVKVDSGLELVFPLSYGRAELGDIVTKATSDDAPIKPGETIYLTIGEVPYWENGVREKRWPDLTKLTAEIQLLSFGDGTGYFGTELYPPPGRRKAAANDAKLPPARAKPRDRLLGKLDTETKNSSIFKQPTIMSANSSSNCDSGKIEITTGFLNRVNFKNSRMPVLKSSSLSTRCQSRSIGMGMSSSIELKLKTRIKQRSHGGRGMCFCKALGSRHP